MFVFCLCSLPGSTPFSFVSAFTALLQSIRDTSRSAGRVHPFSGVVRRDGRHRPARLGVGIRDHVVVVGDSRVTGRRLRGGRNVSPCEVRRGGWCGLGHRTFRARMTNVIG